MDAKSQYTMTIRDDTKKTIHAGPPHLQKMLLRLQKYDYNVICMPGKEMILADRLSRFPSRSENLPIELHHNIQHITFTHDKINIISGATERDPILYTVYHITLDRWPNWFHKVPHITWQFWGSRDELTIDNRLLLKGDRVCIPLELYQRILSEQDEGHKGIEKMQHLTRERIYWQGVDADILEYVKHCKSAQNINPHKQYNQSHPELYQKAHGKTLQQTSFIMTMLNTF